MFSSTFWHVLAENILLVELGQTIAFYEAKMLCLKGNLLRVKAIFPKVNLLLEKALLRKAALLDWSAPVLRVGRLCCDMPFSRPCYCGIKLSYILISPNDRGTHML